MLRRRFRPTLWGTLAALAGVAAGVALGFWQLARAEERLVLVAVQERLAAEPPTRLGDGLAVADSVENRRVEARGRFDERGLILLDNRTRDGLVGYEVVMPLNLAPGGMHVLVNRGWIAGTGDRRHLPAIRTPPEEVTIAGVAVIPGKKLFELSTDAVEGRVWQNLTIERYRAVAKYPIQSVMIQQTNDIGDGLQRVWPTSERKINVHRSYAFQWFALAALIGVIYLVLSLRRDPAHD